MRAPRVSFKADKQAFAPLVAAFPRVITPTAIVRLALHTLAQRIESEGVEKVLMETRRDGAESR